MTKTLLITRPEPDAVRLKKQLTAKGFECLVSPLMHIAFDISQRQTLAKLLSHNPKGIIITSANGIRALSFLSTERDRLIVTVGDSSAKEAEALGYTNVESADGDVDMLADYIKENYKPGAGEWLHVGGHVTTGNLEKLLDGYNVHKIALYHAHPMAELPEDVILAAEEDAIDAVLIYSPRTAHVFMKLAAEDGFTQHLHSMTVCCLSQNVANELNDGDWKEVKVAKQPTESAMMELIEGLN